MVPTGGVDFELVDTPVVDRRLQLRLLLLLLEGLPLGPQLVPRLQLVPQLHPGEQAGASLGGEQNAPRAAACRRSPSRLSRTTHAASRRLHGKARQRLGLHCTPYPRPACTC